jgi:hypothetical protein
MHAFTYMAFSAAPPIGVSPKIGMFEDCTP